MKYHFFTISAIIGNYQTVVKKIPAEYSYRQEPLTIGELSVLHFIEKTHSSYVFKKSNTSIEWYYHIINGRDYCLRQE